MNKIMQIFKNYSKEYYKQKLQKLFNLIDSFCGLYYQLH